MRAIEVEYIESGTFQGGEEDVSQARITYDETCVVLKKQHYQQLRDALATARDEILGFRKSENDDRSRGGTEPAYNSEELRNVNYIQKALRK